MFESKSSRDRKVNTRNSERTFRSSTFRDIQRNISNMSFNLQENKFRIAIPKLKERRNYRSWREGIIRYLETMSMDLYIKHEFDTVYMENDKVKKK